MKAPLPKRREFLTLGSRAFAGSPARIPRRNFGRHNFTSLKQLRENAGGAAHHA